MTDTVVSGQGPAAHSRDIPATRAPGRQSQGGPASRRGVLLAIVLAAQFMALLDVSIVNVAFPTMQASLRASGASLQLVLPPSPTASPLPLSTGAPLDHIPAVPHRP